MVTNNMPLISVVTVSYNAVDTIEYTILSVIKQTYPKIEYIIVDGNSSDGTVEIIRKYLNKISYCISEPDNGIYDAMNKAMKVASGDFIYFLNAGDLFCDSQTLNKCAKAMNYVDSVYYGDTLFCNGNKENYYGGKFTTIRLTSENICHQSLFYPRKVYSSNYYNLSYPILSDWVYNMRLWHRFNFVHLNIIISKYLLGGISSQKEDVIFRKRHKLLIFKYLGISTFSKMCFDAVKKRFFLI